jgi:hypothetical protein
VGIPACARLGPHCRALAVTLRVTKLDQDTPDEQDALATWLLGHTERIAFEAPYVRGHEMLVDAVIHVPCRYLTAADGQTPRKNGGPPQPGAGRVRCAAHGFEDGLDAVQHPPTPPLRLGPGRFAIVQDGRQQRLDLPTRRTSPRSLPVLSETNPCSSAPCRTADNTRGAACCRDLTLDVIAPDGASTLLEDLLRSRRSPYVCKVTRADPRTLECEVISACGYLDDDGVACVLHDRVRPDGYPAKPMVCSNWPDPDGDDAFTGHPGCVFLEEGIGQPARD